nr:hypothetical protein CFP56_22303 [Quercus suber]
MQLPDDIKLRILQEALRQSTLVEMSSEHIDPTEDPFYAAWRQTFTDQPPIGRLLTLVRHAFFTSNFIQARCFLPAFTVECRTGSHRAAWQREVRSPQAELVITGATPVDHRDTLLDGLTRLLYVYPRLRHLRFLLAPNVSVVLFEPVRSLKPQVFLRCRTVLVREAFRRFAIPEIVAELQALRLETVAWEIPKCPKPRHCGCKRLVRNYLRRLSRVVAEVVVRPRNVLVVFKDEAKRGGGRREVFG